MLRYSYRLLGVHPRLCAGAVKAGLTLPFDVFVAEGKRSDARQASLYAQGRTVAGSIVTNAQPGQSPHNYGLAVDLYPADIDGSFNPKAMSSEFTERLQQVADVVKSVGGITWGGDFTSLSDRPHFEVKDWEEKKDWTTKSLAVIALLVLVFHHVL